MAAANATAKAAEAMEQIPGAVLNSIKDLTPTLQEVFSKAFEGKDLTKAEAEAFKEAMGQISYKTTDKDGNIIDAQKWEELDQQTKNIWGSEEAYLRSLDADYSGIDEMWKNLSPEQKKAYGWSGNLSDTEGLEKAKEAFEDTFVEIIEANDKAFEQAEESAKKLGITLSEQLSSSAAQAWTVDLEKISLGAAEGEVQNLNNALNAVLSNLDTEQANLAMAEINAMDKMDVASWDKLGEALANLDITPNADALNALAEAGKKAYNAIVKINFETLANDINNIYKTLGKTKEGNRAYSEADYKEIIASNKNLKDAFVQIGDEFLYVGGSMEALIEALEENTLAKLDEANRQLKARSQMAEIVEEESRNYGQVSGMSEMDLMTYLTNMRQAFADQGLNIADLGIQGLSNNVDFSEASEDTLREWAKAVASEEGNATLYKNQYAKQVRDANIQRYTHNDAMYNAQMAAEDGEYADQHQQALIVQAVQSGGVSNDMIQAYQEAIENGNTELIKSLGKDIAEATDKIVEQSAGRD